MKNEKRNKKLTKKELLQILEEGWIKRRARSQKNSKLNSARTKEWKAQERFLAVSQITKDLAGIENPLAKLLLEQIKRQKHYLGPPSSTPETKTGTKE